ncbi:TPA: hypothetical protein DCZ39_07950 [Patescibacteria group bacterium]|nr:hypothetical protein [Candidatus Gracilibacteria bacterium]
MFVTRQVLSGVFSTQVDPSSDLYTLIVVLLYVLQTSILIVKYPVVARNSTFEPTFTVVIILCEYSVVVVFAGRKFDNSNVVAFPVESPVTVVGAFILPSRSPPLVVMDPISPGISMILSVSSSLTIVNIPVHSKVNPVLVAHWKVADHVDILSSVIAQGKENSNEVKC